MEAPVTPLLADRADPDVSVLLGSYNRYESLQRAVASVRDSVGPYSYEIVVCDGGSTDGSREWLAGQPDVVLVGMRELKGAVRAFNQAWTVSRGRYIANFNDDAEYRDGALEQALDILEHPDTAKVGQVAFSFNLKRWCWRVEAIHSHPYANYGVARREVVEEVCAAQGGSAHYWNPIYHTYGGDSEHSCWVWRLGYEVAPLLTAKVHDGNAQDELRARNDRHGDMGKPEAYTKHPDSMLFWSRWENPETLEADGPPVCTPPPT